MGYSVKRYWNYCTKERQTRIKKMEDRKRNNAFEKIGCVLKTRHTLTKNDASKMSAVF